MPNSLDAMTSMVNERNVLVKDTLKELISKLERLAVLQLNTAEIGLYNGKLTYQQLITDVQLYQALLVNLDGIMDYLAKDIIEQRMHKANQIQESSI